MTIEKYYIWMRGWNKVVTAATHAIVYTYITIVLHVYSQKKRGVCFRELSCSLVSMYLAWKYLVRTLFLRPLLETGLQFYALIRAAQRASRLQGKGSTFIYQLFQDPKYSQLSFRQKLLGPALFVHLKEMSILC